MYSYIQHTTNLKCPACHTLSLTSQLPLRYVGGNYICDVCRKSLMTAYGSLWHCQPCSYDVCLGCATKIPFLRQPPVVPLATIFGPSNKVAYGPVSNTSLFKCDAGHQLVFIKAFPASMNTSNYKCNRCHQDKIVEKDPTWRCMACDYDVCPNCSGAQQGGFNPQVPQQTTVAKLNGSLQRGNYIWGGAMNLAWNEFMGINGGPVDLALSDPQPLANFNFGKFSTAHLSTDSYYVKAGYGQQTVNTINKECRQKFPKKSFGDLQLKLNDLDVIAYAYFVKDVQYLTPFKTYDYFVFCETMVKGFKASNRQQRNNISLLAYESDLEFVVALKLKQVNEQIVLVLTQKQLQPHDILAYVGSLKDGAPLGSEDEFAMPIIELDVERSYSEFLHKVIKSGKLVGYELVAMVQKIKFKIDEVGAKVENEAVIAAPLQLILSKRLLLNRPFWVVMRQKGCHPYFVLQINNTEFMKRL